MKKEVKVFSIGPSTIAQPSIEGGPAFALSTGEWNSIQRYVYNAMSKEIMPHNEPDFRAFLGPAAPKDLSDFIPLINAYKDIFDHVSKWNDETYPESISLASDIVTYANKASVYYNPIIPLAETLTKNPDDKEAKERLEAILDVLVNEADTYQKHTEIVFGKIKEFADQTLQDQIVLSGPDGNGGLYKEYEDQYGETSAEVQELNQQIKDQRAILEQANKDYDHYVVVAATTPTYAWVFPVGTIAGAVVAGTYTDKALKALDDAKKAQKQIDLLETTLQVNTNLMNSLYFSNDTLSGNIESLNNALPVIRKIQGAWGAISDDLRSISEIVKTNIQEALPIIMDLGVEAAINEWEEVGELANAYRLNAYITIDVEAAA